MFKEHIICWKMAISYSKKYIKTKIIPITILKKPKSYLKMLTISLIAQMQRIVLAFSFLPENNPGKLFQKAADLGLKVAYYNLAY